MPFGLGRPVRSTLTLLILVPVLSPLPRAPTRHCAPTRSLPDLKMPAGTPKGAASAVDATPFRWILAQRASILAEDYGRRCPEGMLGVASALPGIRNLTA